MIKLTSFFRMDFQKFDKMIIFSFTSFFWEIWLSTEDKKVILQSWCIFDTLNLHMHDLIIKIKFVWDLIRWYSAERN